MRGRFVAIACATIPLVAGCGSSQANGNDTTTPPPSTERYERDILDIHTEMNTAMSAAFASQQLDAGRVRAARRTADESREQMDALSPPRRYRAAHEEYEQGLDVFAEILADIEQQVSDPDVARRHLRDERFTTGVAHLEEASRLYEGAGLDLAGAGL